MAENPNIFDYAKKELSQDAVIAWLLNCAKDGTKKYKSAGKTFANRLLGRDDEDDIEVFYVEQQRNRIDVYAEVIFDNKVHAVIIEDKVESNLRKNQLVDYYETISKLMTDDGWWIKNIRKEKGKGNETLKPGEIYCVVFKKAYVDDLFLKALDEQTAQIDAKTRLLYLYKGNKALKSKNYSSCSILDCVNKIELKNQVWMDYKQHIEKEFNNLKNIDKNLGKAMENNDSMLIHETVWDILGIPYTGIGHSGGLIHTYAWKELGEDKGYSLRLEKYYRKKLQKSGVFVLALEFYDGNEEEDRWTDIDRMNKHIGSAKKQFWEIIEDDGFLYSKKDELIEKNQSNKFLLIKLQKEENGKIVTIDFKKLKKLINVTWKQYKK